MPDTYGQQFANGNMIGGALGGAWIQGGATTVTSEPARIVALDEAVKNITSSTAYVYEMAEEVRKIADGLFGSIPETSAEKNSGSPYPSGRLGGLQSSTHGLSAALSKLHAEIRRLRDL